jgi:hypothetical protein
MYTSVVQPAQQFDSDSIRVRLYYTSIKKATIPNCQQAPRGSNRWRKGETVQASRTKLFDVKMIKVVPFGFLNANNMACAFIDFIPQSVPFLLGINPPNIPE